MIKLLKVFLKSGRERSYECRFFRFQQDVLAFKQVNKDVITIIPVENIMEFDISYITGDADEV